MVDEKNREMTVAENAVAWNENPATVSSQNDFVSSKIEQAWLDECERRWEFHKKDPASSLSADKVLSELRTKYRL